MKKKLLIIPVVHNEEELGSLKENISRLKEEKLGAEEHKRQVEQVHEFWENVSALISEIMQITDPEKIQVYQDGLPAGGELGKKIVYECAGNKITNYRIIAGMLDRGAEIEQTESPRYIKEEYEIIKKIFSAESAEEQKRMSLQYTERLHELGILRDKYIADRINTSLKDGFTGVIFIGATHNIIPNLSKNIDYYVNDFNREALLHWIKKQT
jgi:hypothetical protein